MRNAGLLLVMLATALAFSFYSFADDSTSTGGVAIGAKAPGFTLQDQTGKNVGLSDFTGKIVVLEWTNPNCPFVQRVYKGKTMQTLASDYSGRNVAWIAVNSTKDTTN